MSIFAAIIRATAETGQAAVEGYGRKTAAQHAAAGGGGAPGCTPCEAMARRQSALAKVSQLRGGPGKPRK